MNKYRIILTTKRGRRVYSEPMKFEDEENWDEESIAEMMEKIVEGVAHGMPISLSVDGVVETFLNHAIESLFWTKGS